MLTESTKGKNLVQEKSFEFAVSIVKYYRNLKTQNEFAIANQLLRAGTSIGANIEEALGGSSKKDFTNKMTIALKEARESKYWLRFQCETRDTQSLPSTWSESKFKNLIIALVIVDHTF